VNQTMEACPLTILAGNCLVQRHCADGIAVTWLRELMMKTFVKYIMAELLGCIPSDVPISHTFLVI